MPNNREWAAFLWLAVFGAWALTQGKVRASAGQALRAITTPKLLVPVMCMAGWVWLEVWLGWQFKAWTPTLATDTIIWFATSGLVLFGNIGEASQQPDFFRRKAVAAFGPALVVEATVDYFVLPLPAEFVLQPMLALLALLSVVANREVRTRRVGQMCKLMMGLIGLGVLAHATFSLAAGWDNIDKADLLRQVALSVWLTIGLLPFIYGLALYSSYEMAFLWLGRRAPISRKARLRSKLAMILGFHVKVHELASFGMPWQNRIGEAASFREALGVIGEFRLAQQNFDEEDAEAD